MQQRRVLFVGIIFLAVAAVIGMYVARPFLFDEPLAIPAISQPVTIQVAVAPSIKGWAEQAARGFNQQDAHTQVRIVEANGLVPSGQFTTNPQVTPPAAWLAEASFMVDLARVEGLQQFEAGIPVAETSLAWGAFTDKQAAFNETYGDLNWTNLHAKAVTPGDSLALVFASHRHSAEGLAVLISAAGAPNNVADLTAADVRQASAWLTEIFRDNTRTPSTPAQDFVTRGRSVGDVGLLSLASWGRAGLPGRSDFVFTPLVPAVSLNYPLAIWTGAPPAEQDAARKFREFLLAETQQAALADFYFERANTAQPGIQVQGEAVQALLRWADQNLR
jgi:hypothetical protein